MKERTRRNADFGRGIADREGFDGKRMLLAFSLLTVGGIRMMTKNEEKFNRYGATAIIPGVKERT